MEDEYDSEEFEVCGCMTLSYFCVWKGILSMYRRYRKKLEEGSNVTVIVWKYLK